MGYGLNQNPLWLQSFTMMQAGSFEEEEATQLGEALDVAAKEAQLQKAKDSVVQAERELAAAKKAESQRSLGEGNGSRKGKQRRRKGASPPPPPPPPPPPKVKMNCCDSECLAATPCLCEVSI